MKYNKEELEIAVKNSLSIADVCRKFNLKTCGGNYKTINNKIKLWNIENNHFTGQAWNQGERYRNFGINYILDDILIENSPYKSSYHLKERLYNEGYKERKCEKCKIEYWNGEEIIFELDHINGITNDNRLKNLRILCPNCHSQTETFRRKKKNAEVMEW